MSESIVQAEVVVSKPKRVRSRKSKSDDESNKENVDPLAVVKPKRVRAVPEPINKPRVKKVKPDMRVIHVDDHETQETFDLPAQFTCSSCKKSHSISEHVIPLAKSSKVFQTCQDCRGKGVEFYRRQKRIVNVVSQTEVGDNGAVAGIVTDGIQVEAA